MTHLTEREPIVHELKTWPQYFAAVRSGKKRFEVRRNDRDFRVGDTLCLVEYDHETDVYSGAGLTCLVTYLLPGGHFGLADDVVVMSLKDAVPSDPVSGEGKCPTCASPDPARHPAVQYGGEVSICKDAFHTPPSPLPAAAVEAE